MYNHIVINMLYDNLIIKFIKYENIVWTKLNKIKRTKIQLCFCIYFFIYYSKYFPFFMTQSLFTFLRFESYVLIFYLLFSRGLSFISNNFGGSIPEMMLDEKEKLLIAQINQELKSYISFMEKTRYGLLLLLFTIILFTKSFAFYHQYFIL